ncbi:MAG: glycosyltransferase [Methanobacteriaceae archaeon]|nr:glycosyltransferase [Methanobacteriaceae archaeon]
MISIQPNETEKELNKKIQDLTVKISSLENHREDLKGQVFKIKDERNRLKEEKNKLNKKVLKYEKENINLINDYNNLKKQNINLQKENYFFKDKLNGLKEEMKQKVLSRNLTIDNLKAEKSILINNFEIEINNKLNYDDATVLIPYSYNHEYLENIEITLKYLSSIGIKNILISEQGMIQTADVLKFKYQHLFKSFEVIFIKYHGRFNRSNAINNGVKNINTNYIFISDGDGIIPKKSYDEALTLITDNFDIVFLFDRKIKDIINKEEFIKDYDFSKIDSSIQYRNNSDGGIILVKKDSLEKIGMYNENFKGWGFEDNEFMLRANYFNLNIIRLPYIFYHLHHKKAKKALKNIDLMDEIYKLYINDQDKLEEYIDNNLKTISENVNINQFSNIEIDKKTFKETVVKNKKQVHNQLLSIIMHVYNTDKKFIDRAIKHLRNQTIGFKNIELIIVNDCSEDKLVDKVLYQYINDFPNIVGIFLDHNSGSHGRPYNIGIEYSTTNYVMFIDGYDYYKDNVCEILYGLIKKDNAKIVSGNYINSYINKSVNWEEYGLNIKENVFQNVTDSILKMNSVIETKIYDKSFLTENNIEFREYEPYSEILFNYLTLLKSDKTIFIDEIVYIDDIQNKENKSFLITHNKQDLINSMNMIRSAYLIFYNEYQDYAYIPLEKVEHWVKYELILSNLTKKEIKEVCELVSDMFQLFLISEKNECSNNLKVLFKSIADCDYDNFYIGYCKLKDKL